jgi:hypothetical protein
MIATAAARADEDHNVQLRLTGAASRSGRRSDVLLELQRRDGQWQNWLRVRAPGLSTNHRPGTIHSCRLEGGATRLEVSFFDPGDYYTNGGRGRYTVTLRPGPGEQTYTGTYKGRFTATEGPSFVAPIRSSGSKSSASAGELPPWLKKSVEQAKPANVIADWPGEVSAERQAVEVSGPVEGRSLPPWPGGVAGHVPPKPGEHPRLLFRKGQLGRLRAFAREHPAGRAMMEQLREVIDRAPGGAARKFGPWPAVGYALAWQMTGEDRWAARARAQIEKHFAPPGGQDIHHAPALVGMALAYDLCYDAWDEAFRQKLTEELQIRVLECHTGTSGGGTMRGLNLADVSNHNAIRVSAAGLGALAILGEKNTEGRTLPVAERIARLSAIEAREYLRQALGGGGWCMEGLHYRVMTMRRGLLAFLTACPNALGIQVNPPGYGDELITGLFREAWPGRPMPRPRPHDGMGGEMTVDGEPVSALVWAMGGALVEKGDRPAFKYLLEAHAGLGGDESYGITSGFYAPFAMAGYPAGLARPPGEVLDWIGPDPANGHWVFRPVWADRDDILMTLNLLSAVRPSCHHERVGVMSNWMLRGLGATWLDGRYHPSVVGLPEAVAVKTGPRTVSFRRQGRTAWLVLDTTPAYMPPAEGKVPAGEVAERPDVLGLRVHNPWPRAVVDYGIRAQRHLVVDATGRSGAPLLVAVVEQVRRTTSAEGPAVPTAIRWTLPFQLDGTELETAGRRFTLRRGRSRLEGVVLGAGPWDGEGRTTASDGRLMAIFVLGRDDVPALKVTGKGLAAKVNVGRRTIHFDGRCVVMGD